MSPPEVTWPDVLAWRTRRHHLHERAPRRDMIDVAAELCGVHAQLMASAELTLWARVEDLEPDAVAEALWTERTLVKQWAMRGTLHLLPARELGLWHAGLSTYRHFLKPSWSKAFGVTPKQLERLIGALDDALDGEPLTREALADRVGTLTRSKKLGDTLRESWGALLKPAAFRGRICFAPNTGQNVRFTRPDSWLDAPPDAVDPDAAVDEILLRYLAVHGPATREDVARWWAGLSPAQMRKRLEGLGEAVVEVDLEGDPHWARAADVKTLAGAASGRRRRRTPTVRLLPAFDQYVIAATRQAANVLPGDFAKRVYRPQGWISPVLLVDGRMDGVWRHERRGRRLELTIEPFVPPAKDVRAAAEAEAERLAGFLGGDLSVSWA